MNWDALGTSRVRSRLGKVSWVAWGRLAFFGELAISSLVVLGILIVIENIQIRIICAKLESYFVLFLIAIRVKSLAERR